MEVRDEAGRFSLTYMRPIAGEEYVYVVQSAKLSRTAFAWTIEIADDGSVGAISEPTEFVMEWQTMPEDGTALQETQGTTQASSTCFQSTSSPIVYSDPNYGRLIRGFGRMDCSPAPNNISITLSIKDFNGNKMATQNISDQNQSTVFGYVYHPCSYNSSSSIPYRTGNAGSADGVTYGQNSAWANLPCGTLS